MVQDCFSVPGCNALKHMHTSDVETVNEEVSAVSCGTADILVNEITRVKINSQSHLSPVGSSQMLAIIQWLVMISS